MKIDEVTENELKDDKERESVPVVVRVQRRSLPGIFWKVLEVASTPLA